jgi:hypothetical protein
VILFTFQRPAHTADAPASGTFVPRAYGENEMKRVRVPALRWTGLFLLLGMLILPTLGAAQTTAAPAPGPLADSWMIWPKAGHRTEFEAALKETLAWRRQAGDPFEWQVYTPVVGEDLGHVVVRSGGHHWQDFDVRAAWAEKAASADHFRRVLSPHVDRMEHYVVRLLPEQTYWPERGSEYRLFGVTHLSLKSGAGREVRAALQEMKQTAEKGNWDGIWAVSSVIGGEGGLQAVWPFTSWADMADRTPTFAQMMASVLGSEEAASALSARLNSNVESSTYSIYRIRPEYQPPR